MAERRSISYTRKRWLIWAFILFQFCTPMAGHGIVPMGLFAPIAWMFIGTHDFPATGFEPWAAWGALLAETAGFSTLVFAITSSRPAAESIGSIGVVLMAAAAVFAYFAIGEVSFISLLTYVPFSIAAVKYFAHPMEQDREHADKNQH